MTEKGDWAALPKILLGAGVVFVVLLVLGLHWGNQSDSTSSDEAPGLAGTEGANSGGLDEPTMPADPSPTTLYKFDGHGANVEASMFGNEWPLTLKSGRVNCVPVTGGAVMVVFTANDNQRYAVNGTARGQAATFGFKDVQSIWADDPKNPGLKKDIGVVIDICAPLMK